MWQRSLNKVCKRIEIKVKIEKGNKRDFIISSTNLVSLSPTTSNSLTTNSLGFLKLESWGFLECNQTLFKTLIAKDHRFLKNEIKQI